MKFILFFLVITNSIMAQILNSGFEHTRDSIQTLPDKWKANIKPGFKWELDSIIVYSGKKSLHIHNSENKNETAFSPFSQVCSITVDKVKKIELTVFIKTKDVTKNVGLWCQLWDSTNKQIGFHSLETQHTIVNGSNDWKKYSVSLIVNPEIKKLLLGGFLQGTGDVWYDDFMITENATLSTKTSNKKANKFIASAIKIAKNNSIVADSINWDKTEKEMKVISQGAQSTKECYPAMNYLISQFAKYGDFHSGFFPPEFNEKNETENMDGRSPISKLFNNSIGYIQVPGFMSVNEKIGVEFATKIQTMIKELDSLHHVSKWIVDLRENTGGNMYPMIAGLGPLLKGNILGYFYSPKRKTETAWEYKNGSSMTEGFKLCQVKTPYNLKTNAQKIIVLIGSHTGSSGEMTAISFIGNENTILVGEASAGFSTGNNGHKLSDGSILNLCETYCKDRNKKTIKGAIQPDVFIKNTANTEIDEALEYAIKELSL